ncbi:mitogen-activated protein kinase kinase kinase 7-like [Drosophila montana]|uniref:mitogen-activated protein kinase kinase kinase 7-like n=1 Tax=Drosophila montana TaxID=40370 RepID=UPI00313AAD16
MSNTVDLTHLNIELLEVIGKGNFTKVYKATNCRQIFSAKIYYDFYGDYNWVAMRCKHLLENKHPNILNSHGSEKITGKVIAVFMEFADGESLYNYIHGSGKYTRNNALNWMAQLAKGLAFLHDLKPSPIFHGNLKPQNLFLFENYSCLKIGDFASGGEVISNCYTPPEACPKTPRNFDKIGRLDQIHAYILKSIKGCYTEKYDVYSFGIILWEVFTRRRPVFKYKREPLLTCIPNVGGSSNIKSLIARCSHDDRHRRPMMKNVVGDLIRISICIKLFALTD